MDGLEQDRKLINDLANWVGKRPSRLATDLGMAATTLARPASGKATTRLGRNTLETLRRAYPDFPGWGDLADETTQAGNSPSLDDIAAEHGLVFLEEIDLPLGMGATYLDGHAEVLDVVPFKERWLRGLHKGPLDRLKATRGRGDSMMPTIMDGDVVIVDTAQRRIDDQDRIWAIAYGDLGMIRRIRVTPRGTWLLMPDNQIVRPDEVGDGEVAVIGRVIWIGRSI